MSQPFNDQQLRDFEVANENLLQPDAEAHDALDIFLRSAAYSEYLHFVFALNDACCGQSATSTRTLLKTHSQSDVRVQSATDESDLKLVESFPLLKGLLQLLLRADKCIETNPPLNQPTRFGNRAFSSYVADVRAHVADWLQEYELARLETTSNSAPVVSATQLAEIGRYFGACFGDPQRIDYGSGHEMNFVCMLACLSRLHQPSSSTPVHSVDQTDQPITRERVQSMALVSLIFARYLRLCRRLQRTYWLEPAGSRGVWGLDDHFFLPFYLGASQLRQHRHLRPKSIRSAEVLEGFSHDYLYLEAVKAIQEIKLASFAEHSPMLNDISEVKTWDKVNSGLMKMYRVEVLGKHAVVQHFIYSSFLPSTVALVPAPAIDVPLVHSVFGHEFHGDVANARAQHAMPNADLFAAPILSSGTNAHSHSSSSSHSHDQGAFKEMPCCSASIRLPSAAALSASSKELRSASNMSWLDRVRAELGSALRAGRFTKSVDVLVKEAGDINISESHSEPSTSQTFSRTLGPLELTCFGIGCIIGAGVYVLTGQVAATTTGPSIVLSMIIAALGSSLSGLCYAELASMFPVAGSAYAYTYAAIGEFWAWMIGWDLVLEYALAVSLVAIGWSQYFVTFLSEVVGFTFPAALSSAPGDGQGGYINLPAFMITALMSVILCYGIKESSIVNIIIVGVKVTVLLIFIFVGIGYCNLDNYTPFIPENTGTVGQFGWSGVFRGAGKIFFAYIGFDAVSTVAQEAKNPQRDMPIGILASLGICTILYIAVALVLVGMVPYAQLTGAHPLTLALNAHGVTWASSLISVGALCGLTSVCLTTLLGQTRIFYSMSVDGLLPKTFSHVHAQYRTPVVCTLTVGSFSAILSAFVPLDVLGDMTSMGTLAAFIVVSISVILLRRDAPHMVRAFVCPFVPYIPIAGSLVCLAQMVFLDWKTWLRCFCWWTLGISWYVLHAHHTGKAAQSLLTQTDQVDENSTLRLESQATLSRADVYGFAPLDQHDLLPHPDGHQ